MNILMKNANIFSNGTFSKQDLIVSDGTIKAIGKDLFLDNATVIDLKGLTVFSGFVDVHVHLREPGFFYKETIESGTRACAHGGYTTVFSMPNLKPCPDSAENLKAQLDIIEKDAVINVIPFGTITVNQAGEKLSDMQEMSNMVCGFSDDGKGVQNETMMLTAMQTAKKLGKVISAHCEDNSLLNGGYIHDGEYANKNGHKGICSESEWGPIKRDIELIRKTGCKYHVCHISCKESVELIRNAKKQGLDITCETAPHYLTMNDMMLKDEGRFKMNPPIRSEADRIALIEGIKDGSIDMIATDHAPHSLEEKSKGLKDSLMGVVGIETAFAVCYTKLVKTGIITLEKLIELLSKNARERFGLGGGLKVGEQADLTVFDLDEKYVINPDDFLSKGRATPFLNEEVYGKCKMTVCKGEVVYKDL